MSTLYQDIVKNDKSGKLQKGIVYCHECGTKRKVDSAFCLANGWPKCCGKTMSLDSPSEKKK